MQNICMDTSQGLWKREWTDKNFLVQSNIDAYAWLSHNTHFHKVVCLSLGFLLNRDFQILLQQDELTFSFILMGALPQGVVPSKALVPR